jgi:hypothetical protein
MFHHHSRGVPRVTLGVDGSPGSFTRMRSMTHMLLRLNPGGSETSPKLGLKLERPASVCYLESYVLRAEDTLSSSSCSVLDNRLMTC